jgi:hypothetical protein
VDIQLVRSAGARWPQFLAAAGLLDAGRDPARHPAQRRRAFLDMLRAEAAAAGPAAAAAGLDGPGPAGPLVSREEAERRVLEHAATRTEKDVRRACGYHRVMCMQYQEIFFQTDR